MQDQRSKVDAKTESVTLVATDDNCLHLAEITWKQARKQIIASCIAQLIVVQVGMNLSFSAILLPQIREEQPLRIGIDEESWIASLVTLSLPFGAFCTGPLMDAIGRKRTCMLTQIPFAIAWLINACATAVWQLYIGRILAGFTSGLTVCSLVYASEISHPNFRPMLLSCNSVFVSLGVLFTCFFGLYLNWRVISLVFACVSLSTLILLSVVPESPQWFIVFKNDHAAATAALRWFYTKKEVYDSQCEYLMRSTKTVRPRTDFSWRSLNAEVQLYRHPTVYRPLGILLALFAFQQFAGCYVFFFYATDLFRKLGSRNAYADFFLLGLLRFGMALLATAISKRVGRRPLFLYSGVGMALASFYAAINMHLHPNANDLTPIVAMLFYVCLSAIAFLVVPWTLASELLPVTVRGRVGGWVVAYAYTLMFVVIKWFPWVMSVCEMRWIFCFVTAVNLLATAFVYVFLPETLGRSFDEIEKYFQ